MNAMAERPAAPDEMAEAADIVLPRRDFEALCAANRERRGKEARRSKNRTRGLLALVGCLGAAVAAEGVALAALSPLVRVEVIHHYTREDGSVHTSRAFAQLPEDARKAAVKNTLTTYVGCREGWISGQAEHCWNAVSALSTKEVRAQFQAEYHRGNPQSFERLYGDKASLPVDVTDIQEDTDRAGAYRVYFTRALRQGEQKGPREHMVATLRVRDVLAPQALPLWQRIRFNAPAIAVWEYPGATHTTPPVGGAAR